MIAIRHAREHELGELERIVRLAFATQLGLPSPEAFGDRALIVPRWRADPDGVFVAEVDGRVVGSNVVTLWGRFGWFGPLSVLPDRWNQGIARALLEPTMQRFAAAGTTTEALFTFSSSPKHLALYQRYDFWPRRLTAVMEITAAANRTVYETLSARGTAKRAAALNDITGITNDLFAGLDVTPEIEAVAAQRIGDTLLVVGGGGRVEAFAIVHCGPGSEADRATAAVKFGAAVSGTAFRALLGAVVDYAAQRAAQRAALSVNAARELAYRATLDAGFRIERLGVAMVRGGASFDHAAAWVIEDLR